MSAVMTADDVEYAAVVALAAMVGTTLNMSVSDCVDVLSEAKYRLGQLIHALESEVRAG